MFAKLPLRLHALRVGALALLLALGACGDGPPDPQVGDLTDGMC